MNGAKTDGATPVAVDGRMLPDGGTGVSHYARTLVSALTAAGRAPLIVQATAAGGGRPARWAAAARGGPVRLIRTGAVLAAPDVFRRAHVHFTLRRRPMRLQVDGPPGVMHWSYPVPLMLEGWANLYTVHDVIPLSHPALSPVSGQRLKAVLRRLAEAASGFVTVSEASRRAILAATGCPAGFVVDCGEAVDLSEPGPVPPYGLAARGYFLHVGSIEPRKNIAGLIEAYRRSGVTLPLVLAGPAGWRSAPLIAAASATPGVRWFGYAGREEVVALLAHARALLMPSLAEGFGLPVAEAATLGTAVICSTDPALIETGGDGALAVDASDPDALAAALVRLAGEDALTAALGAAGRAGATRFTPEAFAGRLLPVYERVAARGRLGDA